MRVDKSPRSVDVPSHNTAQEIEALLSDWFRAQVVLTSSGRSALLLLLQEFGLSRYRNSVAVAGFSSQCVIDTVARVAFPVDAAQSAADVTVFYHQYGFPQSVKPRGRSIEDACHCFFSTAVEGYRLLSEQMPAIFSLPKFFPTTTMVGGIVTTDTALANRIRNRRESFAPRTCDQLEWEAKTFRKCRSGEIELEQVYISRLLNPRIDDSELGGIPSCYSEILSAGKRRQYVVERLLAAAGKLAAPGFSSFVRVNLPYALPILASRNELEFLDSAMKEAGIASDIYQIDVERNMFAPSYVSMLLLPYSHCVADDELDDMTLILRSRSTCAVISQKTRS